MRGEGGGRGDKRKSRTWGLERSARCGRRVQGHWGDSGCWWVRWVHIVVAVGDRLKKWAELLKWVSK